MYDAYNANREQWQCACTIALPRCSLSSTKIMVIFVISKLLGNNSLVYVWMNDTKRTCALQLRQ